MHDELRALNLALGRAAHAGAEVEDQIYPFLVEANRPPVWIPAIFRRNQPGPKPPEVAPGRDQRRRVTEALAEFVSLAKQAHAMAVPEEAGIEWPLFDLPDDIDDWVGRFDPDGKRRDVGPRLKALTDDVGELRAEIHRLANQIFLVRGRLD